MVTTYRVQRKVVFMLNGGTREQVVLEAGDVVQGTTLAQAAPGDFKEYQRMEAQHTAAHRNERIVWVQVRGVVRGLVAGQDCVPSKRPATVPL